MSLRVVVVDDSDIVIFLHTEILSLSGLSKNPLCALNGQSAFDLIKKQDSGDIYLILLDINMPVMDGWQFLETTSTTPDFPKNYVIMVTSSIDATDKKKSANYSNVIGFYEKPLTHENCLAIKDLPEIKKLF